MVASLQFRTPLAAILSSVELLDDYGERLPPDERKMLTLIKTAVAHERHGRPGVADQPAAESGKVQLQPAAAAHAPELLVRLPAEMDRASLAGRPHCHGMRRGRGPPD